MKALGGVIHTCPSLLNPVAMHLPFVDIQPLHGLRLAGVFSLTSGFFNCLKKFCHAVALARPQEFWIALSIAVRFLFDHCESSAP